MNRRFSAAYFITLIFAVAAAGLRLWTLLAAVDDKGLPVMHLSIYIMLGATGVFVVLAFLMTLRSPGYSGRHSVLDYGRGGFICGIVAAVMILLGACGEFAAALVSGPTFWDPIICLLGILGGICLCVVAWFRCRDRRFSPVELVPIVYLLAKLTLNFKGWSTDPIVLDYCVILFALIFSLLAVYGGGGFAFDVGKPKRTLFCAMLSVYFCAAAIMDGVMDLSFATIVTYGGLLLWQLPLIWDLLAPSQREIKHDVENP
jgi:hypothetical protein